MTQESKKWTRSSELMATLTGLTQQPMVTFDPGVSKIK